MRLHKFLIMRLFSDSLQSANHAIKSLFPCQDHLINAHFFYKNYNLKINNILRIMSRFKLSVTDKIYRCRRNGEYLKNIRESNELKS